MQLQTAPGRSDRASPEVRKLCPSYTLGIVQLRVPQSLSLVLLLTSVSACQTWPLYAHLPDPSTEPTDIETVSVAEAVTTGEQAYQSLGIVEGARRFVISGSAESCGFDPSASGPSFAQHPVDADGNGVAESYRARVGWYTGDIDGYSFEAEVSLRVTAELRWAEAPADGENTPYRPDEPSGPWAAESDLDLWMLALPDPGEVAVLADDEGVSRSHPEVLLAGIVLQAGESAVAGVSCHHAVPSDYELTLVARPLGQY